MAIYHLEGKVISRSQGRSSVAVGAYRAAERRVDERTGLVHDFTKKQPDLIHSEILLPQEAEAGAKPGDEGSKGAPEWMRDRERLWNHVEGTEKRKDAQLAREFNIALPRELTHEQNIALAREFVKQEFVDRGMVADLCIHRGHGGHQRALENQDLKAQEEQPLMHVMLSLRELTPEGFGPKEAQARLVRLEEHQHVAHENGQRLLCHPQIALEVITWQRSTFTHQDLARFVGRYTADQAQFTRVYEAIRNAPEVVRLGLDDQGRERMTTQALLALERGMIEGAQNQVQKRRRMPRPSGRRSNNERSA